MTQTDLNRLLACVVEQCRQANIPVSPRIKGEVAVNTRAKTRFGCCRKEKDGYTVEISAVLLSGSEAALRRILTHEVLHTCPGCANHGPRWKLWASRMQEVWGIEVRRTDSHEQLGLTDNRPVRWWVVCQRCGNKVSRMKRSPLVEHPERYRCRCGGQLTVLPGSKK